MIYNCALYLSFSITDYIFYNIYKFLQNDRKPKIVFSHTQLFIYIANKNIILEITIYILKQRYQTIVKAFQFIKVYK